MLDTAVWSAAKIERWIALGERDGNQALPSIPPDFDYNVEAMPLYRIYRMKDSPRQQFRWAPHVSGCASVKPKDYDQHGEIEAFTSTMPGNRCANRARRWRSAICSRPMPAA